MNRRTLLIALAAVLALVGAFLSRSLRIESDSHEDRIESVSSAPDGSNSEVDRSRLAQPDSNASAPESRRAHHPADDLSKVASGVAKSRFFGIVTDTTGRPLAGAVVRAGWITAGPDPHVTTTKFLDELRSRADAEGRYEITVVAGHWCLLVEKGEAGVLYYGAGLDDGLPIPIDAGEEREANLTAGVGKMVRGRVRDTRGEPQKGMTLFLMVHVGWWPNTAVTTDDNGEFRIEGLPAEISYVSFSSFLQGPGLDPKTSSGPWDRYFDIVRRDPWIAPATFEGIRIENRGSPFAGDGVVYRDDIPVTRMTAIRLSPGENFLGYGVLKKDANYSFEACDELGYERVPLTPDGTILRGVVTRAVKSAPPISGQIPLHPGESGFVYLFPNPTVEWIGIRQTPLGADGSFRLENVPDRDDMILLCWIGDDYIKLAPDGYHIPVKPGAALGVMQRYP